MGNKEIINSFADYIISSFNNDLQKASDYFRFKVTEIEIHNFYIKAKKEGVKLVIKGGNDEKIVKEITKRCNAYFKKK